MSCSNWNERLTERLYGEIEPADDAALTAHLDGCQDCRSNLAALTRVRTALREHEPAIPRLPRVVVLPKRARLHPALMAASILGAAILAGAGAGFGYAMGRGQAQGSPALANANAPAASAATEEAVKREVDRRLAAWEAAHATAGASGAAAASSANNQAVSTAALRAELAKLERRVDGARATDLDYVLEQIAASEYRVAHRIGKTNDALRNVALASNAYPSEQ